MKKIYLLIIATTLFLSGCGAKEEVATQTDSPSSTKESSTTIDISDEDNKPEASTDKATINTTDETTSPVTSDETIKESADAETTANETTSKVPNTTDTETTTQVPTTQAPTTQAPTTQAPTTTESPTTTPTPTQPATEATTSKYVVDYTEESSNRTENYKYGLKKIITTTNYYEIYSDGSKEIYYTDEYTSYDTSGYSATDAELLSESNSKAAANIAYYNEVLTLVNEIRAEVGVAPLTLDTTMCQAATMRAVEMNYSGLFSHTRPDGRDCFSVFGTYNISYGWAGENIAAGYGSPASVVTGWKNSPGHYANMINENFTKLGVGLSNEPTDYYTYYWVQLFSS